MNASELRLKILASDDMRPVAVSVPEWGVDVHVKPMSTRAREEFDFWISRSRAQNGAAIREHVVMWCACDSDGNAIFTQDDLPALSEKSSAAIDRIYTAALAINGIGGAAADELEKN
jgi:hypothetical protein